jgi:L-amino acid N-acyltransferase YncA
MEIREEIKEACEYMIHIYNVYYKYKHIHFNIHSLNNECQSVIFQMNKNERDLYEADLIQASKYCELRNL